MTTHRTFIIPFLIAILLTWYCPLLSAAESTADMYYQAEACYRKLQKDSKKRTQRYHWLKCIEQFQEVYRRNPSGSWAAAGLYMTGKLYSELYQWSGKEADRLEARDHFERIINKFPKSGYYKRAKTAVRRVSKSKAAIKKEAKKKAGAAKKQYHRAQSCYQSLLDHPNHQKYRDKWMTCIDKFEAVYRTDPSGPWAAVGLYKSGVLYNELYKHSYKKADRQKALSTLKRLTKKYPQSAYKIKAEKAIAAIESDDNLLTELTGGNDKAKGKTPGKAKQKPVNRTPDPYGRNEKKTAGKAPSGMTTVTGMRFWSNPNYTRLVIDLDKETDYTYKLLRKDPSIHKPQRLYVDLKNSRLGDSIQRIIPIGDDLLENARAGQYAADAVRIVTDIKSLKSYDVFTLKDPFRIVLDIKGSGAKGGRQKGAGSGTKVARIDPKTSTEDIARQLSLGVRRIVIDPGHGGKDYGAPGYLRGVHEKNVTLQIAKRLRTKLRKELKCEVIMTRTSDRYMTLEERTAFANTKDADLFISIHTNANRDRRAYGISTYFLNMASDEEAKMVAAKENATSTNNISDLETILFSLMHNSKINESSRLAAYIQDAMVGHLKKKGYSRVKNKGVKQAPFYVLLGAQMPSVLLETSFISNPRECRRLVSAKYQERLCEAIVAGVKKYIKETNPTAFKNSTKRGGKRG
jgi:N-acetylmuramoyl-L-alanine amidase